MGHTALSSHFLLLWALALYFESLRRGRAKVLEMTALLAVTLLINSYLFAMVVVFLAATFIALRLRGQLTWQDGRAMAAGVLFVTVLGIVAGYGTFLVSPTTMKSEGFGHYSWNVVTLLLPRDGIFGYMTGVVRDATKGQYEGDAYVGRGVLLLLALALVFTPRKALRHIRAHWVYVATVLALAAYAATNKVYFGSTQIVEYPLPQFVIDLGNYFRATGRFIWPLVYSLAILPVALLFRWWHPAPAVAAAALGVFLQVNEGWEAIQYRRILTNTAAQDLINTPLVSSWLAQHDRLWQYPSWACGGLGGSKRWAGNLEANRELQVQLAAAVAGVPTNSVYTSRLLKSCPTEFTWVDNPQLEEGVFYLLGPETVAASPTLIKLARTNACVTLEWGVACSLKWSKMAAERGIGSQPIHK
jgi:hypothetical protein